MNFTSRLKQLGKILKDADGCDKLPDALRNRRELARLLQLTNGVAENVDVPSHL